MKYKRIPSALHNVAHSFVSHCNYVDGRFIVDLLPGLVADVPGGRIEMSFPSGQIEPPWPYPDALRNSVRLTGEGLAKQLASQGITLQAISGEVRILVLHAPSAAGRWTCRVQATDDRGREYDIPVVHA